MKLRINFIALILFFCHISIFSQTIFENQEYYAIAPSGLLIRNQPSLKGDKIGKIRYSEKVKLTKDTGIELSIKDEGRVISGNWVYVLTNSYINNEQVKGYVFSGFLSNEEPLKHDHIETVSRFISYFKTNNKEAIKKTIKYPFDRPYPIQDIENEDEFLTYYDEIFDKELEEKIKNSSPVRDWSAVGWRGIMLKRGTLWLDYDGSIKGILHETQLHKDKMKKLIEEEKNTIHKSIRDYKRFDCMFETKTQRIRIDLVDDKKYVYRLAIWKLSKSQKEKPDLILYNGKVTMDGSGGNHYFEFYKGIYKYICYNMVLSTRENPYGSINVYKDSKQISEDKFIKRID